MPGDLRHREFLRREVGLPVAVTSLDHAESDIPLTGKPGDPHDTPYIRLFAFSRAY